MKKGCLTALLIWAGAAGAYWMFLRTRLEPPESVYASIAAGLFISVAIGALRTAALSVKRARKLGTSSMFVAGERPQDGDVIAGAGHIRASGPVLTAPFTRRPAVLYSYDIREPRATGRNTYPASVYSGFALTPSVVDTPAGAMRLLGFPMPEKWDLEEIAPERARDNAAAWVASTSFSDFTGFQYGTMYREVTDAMTDDDGQVRKDWQWCAQPSLDDKRFFEYVLAPGDPVCVMGRYSVERGGIVSDIAEGNKVELLRGDPRSITRTMWWEAVANIGLAIVIAAVTNGVLYAYLFMVHR